METYIELDLIQGSKKWLDYKRNTIGASEAYTIMGQSPFKTPFRLWQEKLGLVEPEPYNENMRRGHELEPRARDLINVTLGMDFKPMVLQSLERPWMIASYDGIASDGTILEIKCPKNGVHETIPDYYRAQLMHQMIVAGQTKCLYMSYHEGNFQLIGTCLDYDFANTMIQQEKEFYKCLMELEAPELCDRDYVNMEGNEEWRFYSNIWKDMNEKKKYYEKSEKEIRDKLIQLSGNANCQGSGLKLSKIVKKGAIDWKSIPGIDNLEPEKYRAKPVEYWRVS